MLRPGLRRSASDLGLCLPYAVFAQSLALLQSLALGHPSRQSECGGRRESRGPGRVDLSLEPAGRVKTFLGVDGGGTKTEFVLIDEAGRVLARHQEGPAYYLEIGLDALRAMLARGIGATLRQAALSASAARRSPSSVCRPTARTARCSRALE